MHSNSTRLQTLTLIALLAFMMACRKTPQQLIVGKWQDVDGSLQLQFFPDGTTTAIEGPNVEFGTYSFPDATHLKIVTRVDISVFDIDTLTRESLVMKHEGLMYHKGAFKRVN